MWIRGYGNGRVYELGVSALHGTSRDPGMKNPRPLFSHGRPR